MIRLQSQRFCSLLLLETVLLRSTCNSFSIQHPLHLRMYHVKSNVNQGDILRLSMKENEASADADILHDVGGIMCREVGIDVKNIGRIKILEATADSQNDLVEMACATEEEMLESGKEQIVKSSDPYGAVLWPAASAVSDYLLTTVAENRPSNSLEGLTILELGTGTGLCAIAAALGGASKIMATDYEPVPLKLLEFAASHVNVKPFEHDSEDGIKLKLSRIETSLFDICSNDPLPKADVMIAADIMYEPVTGIAAAVRTVEALKAGSRVIIGCSPGRPGRPHYVSKLKELLPNLDEEFQDVEGRTCSGPRNDLICGEGSSSISVEPKPLAVALIDLLPEKCL
jgi:predicted nicotinamide N-methyase